MESLSETKWDAVLSGTGLQHSLLALALSRSNKKILHVDQNDYYGGAEAAFSLDGVDEWVEKVKGDSSKPFRNVSLWKTAESEKLPFSRSYTLTLSPQIIYTRSKLLGQLVSSKVYKQLEFQAVGNWWMYGEDPGTLKRLPNGREDIFQDKSIDNRAKRSLMKFLKFVVDYENQVDVWGVHSEAPLDEFLSSQFQFPSNIQAVVTALTLSLEIPNRIPVKWALPRIARHLTSIGLFGPGFGSVVPKWGGGAEISQVACRAGAVGGGVYVLGTGVQSSDTVEEDSKLFSLIQLSNGETVKTQHLIKQDDDRDLANPKVASKIIAVVSSPLVSLFKSSVEGSPLAAVSVVVFTPCSITVEGVSQPNPLYIMVHSSDTGECPTGQCVLYATTLYSDTSKSLLEASVSKLIQIVENGDARLLYSLYYEQEQSSRVADGSLIASDASLDLAFNDEILQQVEDDWRLIMSDDKGEDLPAFMQFEDRQGMDNDDDDEF